jgi:hypothetical protein
MSGRSRPNDEATQREIFSIAGSHFVDIYYNHVYESSKKSLPRGHPIQTEYSGQVQTYIIGVKGDKKIYKAVLANLYDYFRFPFSGRPSRYEMLTFAQFVDLYVKQFVPPDYFAIMTSDAKDEILSLVICSLVAGLGAYMTSTDLLLRTIDHHDDMAQQTIRMAQNKAIEIQRGTQIDIENKFLRKAGEVRETLAPESLAKVRDTIRSLVETKVRQEGRIRKLEEEVTELEQQLGEYRDRDIKSRKLIQMLKAEREHGLVGAAGAHLSAGARDYGIGEGPASRPAGAPVNRPAPPAGPYITPGLDLLGEAGALAVAPAPPAARGRGGRPGAGPSTDFFAPPAASAATSFFAPPATTSAGPSTRASTARQTHRGQHKRSQKEAASRRQTEPEESIDDLVVDAHSGSSADDDSGRSGSGSSDASDSG